MNFICVNNICATDPGRTTRTLVNIEHIITIEWSYENYEICLSGNQIMYVNEEDAEKIFRVIGTRL